MHEKKQDGHRRSALWAALALAAAVLALLAVWRLLAPRGAAGEKHLTVEVVHGDGSVREFALDTDEACLGPALVAGGVVEDNQGPYGLYILTADGETAREAAQEWWRITRDGEAVNTGADSTPIAGGDVFELTFTTGYDGF